jgi:hypothetical protein
MLNMSYVSYALLNGDSVGQQERPAVDKWQAASVGNRRVSLAPSKAGTSKVSLKP